MIFTCLWHRIIKQFTCLCCGETKHFAGQGFGNNTLLDDDQYLANIRETYVSACDMHSAVKDKRLFWEMLKLEFRSTTISYSKNKSKLTHAREEEVKSRLEEPDRIICNHFYLPWYRSRFK